MDVAHGEMVEKELDLMIRRADERRRKSEGERLAEELWQVSARIYNTGKARERAVAWYCYEKRLERLHASLAAEHEAKAQ